METAKLLDEIEVFAQRKLRYRPEISALLELVPRGSAKGIPLGDFALGSTPLTIASGLGRREMLADIIFLAKFLWNVYNLMQRIGPAEEGYPKLSAEFRDALEKFSTLIKTLIKESSEEMKEKFKTTFFSLSQESMSNLVQLASDLSWLKNYAIDTKKSLV